jgi:type VI secretion system protein ImpA
VAQPTQLRGRDDAYRSLAQIADYLAQLEPHSPVPPLIRRAIEWGNMSFVDLMAELTSNNGELQRLLCRPLK